MVEADPAANDGVGTHKPEEKWTQVFQTIPFSEEADGATRE